VQQQTRQRRACGKIQRVWPDSLLGSNPRAAPHSPFARYIIIIWLISRRRAVIGKLRFRRFASGVIGLLGWRKSAKAIAA
jgi:hypothetical protein